MARNRPVAICVIRQIPRSEPKFHNDERFEGVGRSTNDPLIIFNSGWVFRIGWAIGVFIVEYNIGFSSRGFRLESG